MQHNVPSAEPCGARRPGWERPGPGRHRLPCILPAGHDGRHRDALGQTWDGPFPASTKAAGHAVAQLDSVRRAMRDSGHSSATVEDLIDKMSSAAVAADDPAAEVEELFRLMRARRRPDAPLMRVDAPQVNRCSALDGQCTGEHCGENGDPREPIHHGPEHGLNVSFADDPLTPFQLTQCEDEQPRLTVYAGGAWPDLTLAQVDELLLAFDEYTGALRVAREHLARAVVAQDAQDGEPRGGAHRDGLDLDRLAAALPDAVRVAMQEVMPDRYTPELAEQIAADTVAHLTAAQSVEGRDA